MAGCGLGAIVLFILSIANIVTTSRAQLGVHATFYSFIDAPACGYGPPRNWVPDAISSSGQAPSGTPYTTAVSGALFKGGSGCGACYTLKCVSADKVWGGGVEGCTGKSVTVTVIDLCPYKGNEKWCSDDRVHFDLSIPAWEQIGKDRKLGHLEIDYQRVPCNPTENGQPLNLAVKMREQSSKYWQTFFWYHVRGVGTLSAMSTSFDHGNSWRSCHHDWGAGFACQGAADQSTALSFRLTSGSGQTLTLIDALGAGWLDRKGETVDLDTNFAGGLDANGGGGGGLGGAPTFQRTAGGRTINRPRPKQPIRNWGNNNARKSPPRQWGNKGWKSPPKQWGNSGRKSPPRKWTPRKSPPKKWTPKKWTPKKVAPFQWWAKRKPSPPRKRGYNRIWRRLKGKGPGRHYCQRGKYRNRPCKTTKMYKRPIRHMA